MGERATIDKDYLYGAADAIRRKNGTSNTYTPAQLEAAIDAIPSGITPTGTISITQNGVFDVTNYASAAVNVPSGPEVSLPDSRMVFVYSSSKYYCGMFADIPVPSSGTVAVPSVTTGSTGLVLTANKIKDVLYSRQFTYLEFQNYVTTQLINDFGLVLLAEITGEQDAITLSDSIINYKALVVQGVFANGELTSQYNTSLFYANPTVGMTCLATMKDRHHDSTTWVTFDSATSAVLTVHKRCRIYGMGAVS